MYHEPWRNSEIERRRQKVNRSFASHEELLRLDFLLVDVLYRTNKVTLTPRVYHYFNPFPRHIIAAHSFRFLQNDEGDRGMVPKAPPKWSAFVPETSRDVKKESQSSSIF